MRFSEAVTVQGTPTLELETGTTDATVSYVMGQVQTRWFSITLWQILMHRLILIIKRRHHLFYPGTGSTIRNLVSSDATLTLATMGESNSLGGSKALVIDGVRPSVSSSAANAGTRTVTITMSESLTGSPDAADFTVLVNGSGNTVTAAAVSGTKVTLTLTDIIPNSATVTWTYAQNSSSSKYILGAASSSNAANSVVSITSNQSVTVTDDVSAPTVSSVALGSGVSGVQGIGDVIPIVVTFNEAVVVTGTPTLELETGTSDATSYAMVLNGFNI